MPIAVPSSIVEIIELRFDNVDRENLKIPGEYAPVVSNLLALIDRLPDHLVSFRGR